MEYKKSPNYRYKLLNPEMVKKHSKLWYQRHKDKQLEAVKARIKALQEQGRCITCGDVAVTKNHCEYHRRLKLQKDKKYYKEKKREKLAAMA